MSLPRFFVPELSQLVSAGRDEPLPDACVPPLSVTLDDEQAHHAARVLRMRDGDAAEAFSGTGVAAQAILRLPSKHSVLLELREVRVQQQPRLRLEVATAIPKGSRAETLIEQLCQLGVTHLIPLLSERSVVEPRDSKLQRFARTVIETCRQCGRAQLMSIAEPTDLGDLLGTDPAGLELLASPQVEGSLGTAEVLARLQHVSRVRVYIGPEGGFSPAELDLARSRNVAAWSFNPHILRIETAAVAAAAIIRAMP